MFLHFSSFFFFVSFFSVILFHVLSFSFFLVRVISFSFFFFHVLSFSFSFFSFFFLSLTFFSLFLFLFLFLFVGTFFLQKNSILRPVSGSTPLRPVFLFSLPLFPSFFPSFSPLEPPRPRGTGMLTVCSTVCCWSEAKDKIVGTSTNRPTICGNRRSRSTKRGWMLHEKGRWRPHAPRCAAVPAPVAEGPRLALAATLRCLRQTARSTPHPRPLSPSTFRLWPRLCC